MQIIQWPLTIASSLTAAGQKKSWMCKQTTLACTAALLMSLLQE